MSLPGSINSGSLNGAVKKNCEVLKLVKTMMMDENVCHVKGKVLLKFLASQTTDYL